MAKKPWVLSRLQCQPLWVCFVGVLGLVWGFSIFAVLFSEGFIGALKCEVVFLWPKTESKALPSGFSPAALQALLSMLHLDFKAVQVVKGFRLGLGLAVARLFLRSGVAGKLLTEPRRANSPWQEWEAPSWELCGCSGRNHPQPFAAQCRNAEKNDSRAWI